MTDQLALPAHTPYVPPPKPPRVHAPMSKDDWSLLVTILGIQSDSGQTEQMRSWCRNWARTIEGVRTQRHEGNLYITKGEADLYPCYVAHLDTVHDILPAENYKIFQDTETDDLFGWDEVNQREVGCGGDDKVGIAIALIMLRDLPVCKVALFRDEEIGCRGARLADMSFFDNCMFAIECDRRGNADIVKSAAGTELHGPEFTSAIQPAMDFYGYSYSWGASTDVKALKEQGLKIATCNLSCGYFDPHLDKTYVVPDDVGRCIALVKAMTELLDGRVWEHTYTRPVYTAAPPKTHVHKNWTNVRKDTVGVEIVWERQADGSLLMTEKPLNPKDVSRPTVSSLLAAERAWGDCPTDWEVLQAIEETYGVYSDEWAEFCDQMEIDPLDKSEIPCPECERYNVYSDGYCSFCGKWTVGPPAEGTEVPECPKCGTWTTEWDVFEEQWYCPIDNFWWPPLPVRERGK
jgi:tripeptide aminopeptidase